MDQPSGLIQDHHTKNSSVQDSDLKKSPNGITLVPQPSEDPRDPLVSCVIPYVNTERLTMNSIDRIGRRLKRQ